MTFVSDSPRLLNVWAQICPTIRLSWAGCYDALTRRLGQGEVKSPGGRPGVDSRPASDWELEAGLSDDQKLWLCPPRGV